MSKPFKFPAKLGACIDLQYTLREQRIEYQREVEEKLKEMKAHEKSIEDHIINTFSKSDIEGAKGSLAVASITRNVYPKVTDWDQFHAYIRKTGLFELLERRPAKVAFRERHEAGVVIPGVDAYTEIGLSLTKVKSK